MSLTDTDFIREYHDLLENMPPDPFLNNMIRRGERKLRKWVGDEAYDDASSPTPSDPDRAADLKDAEAELVIFYAIPKLNLKIGDSGILQSGQHGEGSYTLATPAQIEKLRAMYFQNAEDYAGKYMSGGRAVPVKVAE